MGEVVGTGRKLLSQVQEFSADSPPLFDFHLHTTWTDGENTVAEMYEQAVQCGLRWILFSEHARATSEDWFHRYAAEVRALPASPCEALVGVESKINDFDGLLDCAPGIISACDLVMASVHRFPGERGQLQKGLGTLTADEAIETELRLALAALDNPDVDILGHPFGMCYRRFFVEPPPEKMRQIIEKAARCGVAFEVNSRYHPDPWQLIEWCRAAGATISVGSNAHNVGEVGQIMTMLRGQAGRLKADAYRNTP